MGAALARFVPAPSGVAIPRGEKLGILVRLNKSQHLRKSRICGEFTAIRGKAANGQGEANAP
jgi:hypothetical protein